MDDFSSVFLWSGVGLLFLALLGLPLLAIHMYKQNPKALKLAGLGLPEGSVRSMLAILIVGTYMIVVFLGAGYKGTGNLKYLEQVLSALAGVAGAVVGFYFGSRKKQEQKNNGTDTIIRTPVSGDP